MAGVELAIEHNIGHPPTLTRYNIYITWIHNAEGAPPADAPPGPADLPETPAVAKHMTKVAPKETQTRIIGIQSTATPLAIRITQWPQLMWEYGSYPIIPTCSTSSKIIKFNPIGVFQLNEGWELSTGPHDDTNLATGSRGCRLEERFPTISPSLKSDRPNSSDRENTRSMNSDDKGLGKYRGRKLSEDKISSHIYTVISFRVQLSTHTQFNSLIQQITLTNRSRSQFSSSMQFSSCISGYAPNSSCALKIFCLTQLTTDRKPLTALI
ncbi:DNA glycosylase/AP lyase domain containing protein [Dorcoceras hygrometricum]|uniref:DNA glycosylase/AP lyase domain containing protein n=1 Tax=Dorcoceras hygrometricum TaxID=472368 RepID=A0A2Z7D3J0_9LAMI|nr:DNA glycosylase/AP lyase domain containing protein [Dorcoceras hygrometricum]